MHLDHPEIEPGVVAKEKVVGPDGEHQVKVTKGGKVVLCSKCAEIREKYAEELAVDPKLKKKLDDIEALLDPRVKARKAAEFESELSQRKLNDDFETVKENVEESSGRFAKDDGGRFEEQIQNEFRHKVIRKNESIYDGGKEIGEIDFETDEALVEVGISLRGKTEQLYREAEIAAQRGKRLDVIYGPRTSAGRLAQLKASLRKKWGSRVRFIPRDFNQGE
jgi:hypothetical protein